jgi:hypothetical protein
MADCHGNSPHDTGYEDAHEGATSSAQYVSWELRGSGAGRGVRVESDASSGMSTDICLDAIFDWMTVDGHFDARVTRNCAPGWDRISDSGGDFWEPDNLWGPRTLTGIQKGAGCKYEQVSTSGHTAPWLGDCDNVTGHQCVPSTVAPWTDLAQRVWVRHQDTTIDYNSGGVPYDPYD